jgi:nucleotide-binding universal stress UspA family protein
VVHVQIADGLTHPKGQNLHRHRELTTKLGGSYTEMTASNPAQALADIARARDAATVVVGHHRSRLGELAHGSVASRLRRLLPEIVIEEVRKTDRGHLSER